MEQNNVWLEIVKEALDLAVAEKASAVSGAKLRSKTSAIAKSRKLEFPPPGMGKFSSFVEGFPHLFDVRRQAGQDILIAPASRPELFGELSSADDSSAKRLREDIFNAMTLIDPDRMPVYFRESDQFFWTNLASRSTLMDAVDFPRASLEKEIATRRTFAEKIKQDEARELLLAALETTGPLKTFTAELHALKLMKEWHGFRFASMSKELAEWAQQNNVPWQPSWLSLAEPKLVPVTPPAPMVEPDVKKQWLELAAKLSDADIARVSIPLDIVLRLISKA